MANFNTFTQSTAPLTTTASDTNIPINKSVPLDTPSSGGSSDSVHNDRISNQSHIPTQNLIENVNKNGTNRGENKERLFKRKDEGYMSATRSRQLRRKNNLENKQSLDKERSSSLSRLLDE